MTAKTPRRALIVIDVQNEYVTGNLQIEYPPVADSLAHITHAMDTATTAGIPVIVIQQNSPADGPAFAEGSDGGTRHRAGGLQAQPGQRSAASRTSSPPARHLRTTSAQQAQALGVVDQELHVRRRATGEVARERSSTAAGCTEPFGQDNGPRGPEGP